jgi:CheY-like chemotaxis protein
LLFRAADGHEAGGAHDVRDESPDVAPGIGSVLVIDDDPDVRGFISEGLEELGYRVRQAADGNAGLSEYSAERPDLVVLDFIMPGLSGADVATEILAAMPGQPILFVSGYSETELIKRIAPNAPLLTKPFRAETLAKAVRSALAKA